MGNICQCVYVCDREMMKVYIELKVVRERNPNFYSTDEELVRLH